MRFLIVLLLATTASFAHASASSDTTYVPTHSGIYLPGDYQGWAPSTAPSFVFDSATDIWIADSVVFTTDTTQVKFTDAPDWSHNNYGLDTSKPHTDTSGTGINVGSAGNIMIILTTPGAYAVLFNDSSNVYDVVSRSSLTQLGVSEIVKTSIHLWPNPATDQVTFTNSRNMNQLFITNMSGKNVMKQSLKGNGLQTVNTASLPAGVYIVTLSGANGSSSTKLTIQR